MLTKVEPGCLARTSLGTARNDTNAFQEMSYAIVPQSIATARPERPDLTLFLWMLCGYLIVDAGSRLWSLGVDVSERGQVSQEVLQRHFEGLMFATLDLLLVLQIFLRTLAARIFGSILFVFQIVSSAVRFCVRSPETWLSLQVGERLQVLGHIVLCSVALVLLNRRPTREVLRH